jgi:hypothetical protein
MVHLVTVTRLTAELEDGGTVLENRVGAGAGSKGTDGGVKQLQGETSQAGSKLPDGQRVMFGTYELFTLRGGAKWPLCRSRT